MPWRVKQTVEIHPIELPTPLPVGTVNAYVLMGEDQVVLVDCGIRFEPAWQQLLDALKALRLSPSDVTALVLTHPHVDHVGWAGRLQAAGARIYAHADAAPWLNPESRFHEDRQRFYKHLYTRCGMPQEDRDRALQEFSFLLRLTDRSVVDEVLAEGDTFPPLPQFRVLHVPGHAQPAIALWNEETGDLIIGDQLLPHISSNAIVEPTESGLRRHDGRDRTRSLVQYRENLKALRELGARRVFPGHGRVFDHANELIEQRLREQMRRRDQLLDLLRRLGPCPAYALATTYFPRHRHQASLILSEVLGYLDWMAVQGLAEERAEEDTRPWSWVALA